MHWERNGGIQREEENGAGGGLPSGCLSLVLRYLCRGNNQANGWPAQQVARFLDSEIHFLLA